jgi:hypothetical protein
MTRDDVLTPQQFADAIGRDLKSLERWTDLPWSPVNAHTKFMVWGDWLDYLKARRLAA